MTQPLIVKVNEVTILIEPNDEIELDASGLKQIGVAETLEKNLEKMLSVVKPFCEALMKNIQDVSPKPKSVSAEFGLTFSGEGNVWVAKVSGEAAIKVSIEWQPI